MGAQNIHPHPPPLKHAFWPKMGGAGKGVYNFSLDVRKRVVAEPWEFPKTGLWKRLSAKTKGPRNQGARLWAISASPVPPRLCMQQSQRLGRPKWQPLHGHWKMDKNKSEVPPANQTKERAKTEKFMNFTHFCELWCFSLGKQARFTLNFCSGMPLRKVHELPFFWFGLPGPLLKIGASQMTTIRKNSKFHCHGISQEKERFWTIFRKCPPSPTPSKTQILLILSFRRL